MFFCLRTGLVFTFLAACFPCFASITGHVDLIESFNSKYVSDRNIEVWLPPNYASQNKKHFPVLYVQDGQNVFNPKTSSKGIDIGIDEAMTQLIADKKVRDTIVVAIWNSPERIPEYVPILDTLADRYLEFMVKELKPYIDENYRTLTDQDNTYVMGASLGGLISLFALTEYPDVFGGCAAISTHWPVYFEHSPKIWPYLEKNPPSPSKHRLYFSYGTRGLDADYEPGQQKTDALLEKLGFDSSTFMTIKFEDGDHNEASWGTQIHHPLTFLLKN